MSIGPKITVRRSCADCEACQGERYTCQSDSGTDVYCAHPSLPVRRIIGDSRWDTPQWCPAEPEIAARADAKIATLSRLLAEAGEVVADAARYLAIDPRGREAELARLNAMVEEIGGVK